MLLAADDNSSAVQVVEPLRILPFRRGMKSRQGLVEALKSGANL